MDAKPERREEVLKILQMIEEGKIDQDKALSMIALLEGQKGVGISGIFVTDGKKKPLAVRVLFAIVEFALVGGLLFALFFYLPVNGPLWSVIVVYSFLGLVVLAGAAVGITLGITAITKAMAVASLAIEKKLERRDSAAPLSGEESGTHK